MAKRILWLSQHSPAPSQVARLQGKYGADVQILRDTHPFESAEEIISRIQAGMYDDYVVVAPRSVIGRLCELVDDLATEAIRLPKPLYAQMQQLPSSKRHEADFAFKGRYQKFLQFRRVKRDLGLEFEEGQDF